MLSDNLQTGNRRSAQVKVLPEIKSSLGRREEKKKKTAQNHEEIQ